MAQVISGVAPGNRVVTEGTDRLREGALVKSPTRPRAQRNPTARRNHSHKNSSPAVTSERKSMNVSSLSFCARSRRPC